jgi:hypothetical protein
LQRRLENATKALWPERRHRITFYSYRHQLSSDFKRSDMSRVELAAIMGHQSVDSAKSYGDRRKGKGRVSLQATIDTLQSVRKKISKSPSINPI